MNRALLAACVMAAALAACGKSNDASAPAGGSSAASNVPNQTATATAPASSPSATPAPSKHASAGAKPAHAAAISASTQNDVSETGLPLYPHLDPGTSVIRGSDQNGKSLAISARTSDAFPAVDAWYASHLGADFQASRLNFGIVHITTFKKGDGRDASSVILTAAKNPRTHAPSVAIMLLSKST